MDKQQKLDELYKRKAILEKIIQEKEQTVVKDDQLFAFKDKLMVLLDERGFSAVPEVLKEVENCPYSYEKPSLANLRQRAEEQLTQLAPANYIVGLKTFIDSLK